MSRESQTIPEEEYGHPAGETTENSAIAAELSNGQEAAEQNVSSFVSKETLGKIKDILKEEAVAVLIKVLVKVILGGVIGLGFKEREESQIKASLKTEIIDNLGLESQDQETKDKIVEAVSRAALNNRGKLPDMTPDEFLAMINEELNKTDKN